MHPLYKIGFCALANRLNHHLVARFLFTGHRSYAASSNSLSWAKHRLARETAANRFIEAERGRLLAPLSQTVSSQFIVNAAGNPLRKVFFPFFGVNAAFKQTDYEGKYGILKHEISIKDGKPKTKTRTDWYHISGSLGPSQYQQEDDSMRIYAGLTWKNSLIERAFVSEKFSHVLQPFQSTNIDSDAWVDPFVKRCVLAQEIAWDRIQDLERDRIRNDIRRRTNCDFTCIHSLNSSINSLHLTAFYLPGYILEYPHSPARVLSALSEKGQVVGTGTLSKLKCMTLAGIASIAFSLFFPEISLALRLGMVASTCIGSGLWAHYRSDIVYHHQQASVSREKLRNEEISETRADKRRRLETEPLNREPLLGGFSTLEIDPLYFQKIDLDPAQQISEELVNKAFYAKISVAHPDRKTGSNHAARELIEARNSIITAIRKRQGQPGVQQRNYSSIARPAIRVPPRSVFHHRAAELIDAVLVQKNYDKALKLVEEEEVHPDAHDKGENTLLAEAAKQGDVEAIRFAIGTLGSSPDSSCDCPAHKTALHYAVERGHLSAVKCLLELRADPNLINSYGQTPLDIAMVTKNEHICLALKGYGAMPHVTEEGKAGMLRKVRGILFGYGSSERTKLLAHEEPEKISAPKKT
jgi:hypothetical protein